ncbi:CrcB family protein [Prescottella defluvii]|nr:CrcB family protein [Prescottella defluvii]
MGVGEYLHARRRGRPRDRAVGCTRRRRRSLGPLPCGSSSALVRQLSRPDVRGERVRLPDPRAARRATLPATVFALLGTGFCGGLTTYSTFANEATGLVRVRRSVTSVTYVTASLVVGIGFAWLGFRITG